MPRPPLPTDKPAVTSAHALIAAEPRRVVSPRASTARKGTTAPGTLAPARSGRSKAHSAAGVGRSAPPVHTLAQLDQTRRTPGSLKPFAQAGLTPESVLLKRARAKFLSTPLGAALAEYRKRQRLEATAAGGEPDAAGLTMERAYRSTVYCSGTIDQEAGKLTSRYCGNRWCLVCNRVRTGLSMARYLPVLSAWRAPHMVTLTAPNVAGPQLAAELRRYLADFVAIKRAMKRTHRTPLVAVRKLECTYNAHSDTYHPHFHVVVQTAEAAKLLRDLWLDARPDAVRQAQDVRPADAGSLRELFKYFTKLITRTRNRASQSATVSVRVADAGKLDTIFAAMRGLRVFQPVGFTLPKDTDDEAAKIGEQGHTAAPDRFRDRLGEWPAAGNRWRWSQDAADWITEHGECLAEYTPSPGMRTLVAGIADTPPPIPPPRP